MIEETKHKDTLNGVLPDEWDVVMLEDVAEFSKKPRSLNSNNYKKVPFIPMEYIPDGEIYISKYKLKNQDEIKSGTFFYKGDLLVAKITPSFENGKQCIINDLPMDFGYATTEVWPLHGTDRCDLLYLFYYLKKHEIRTEIATKMEGSTGRQRVPKNVLANLEIPLPPIPEQHRIAAVLSAVQDAKEKTEAVIAAAKSLKKSLMRHLFTYGPVPAGAAESAALVETEIGLVPEGWGVVRLGDKGHFRYGYTTSATGEDTGTKFLRITDIKEDGIVNWGTVPYGIIDDKHLQKFRLSDGDVLFARIGATTGKTCIIEGAIPNAVFASYLIRFVPNNELNPKYVFYFTQTREYRELVNAGKEGKLKKGLSATELKNFITPLPPLPTQQKIASILSTVDKKIEAEENKKIALGELFRSLLHNLMTGKVRVNHLEMPQ